MTAATRRKRTRRLPAAERRRRILESSVGVFAERGYRGATTAQLARAAGISQPILYRHFRSKHDLFVCLIDEVGPEVIHAWEQALAEAANPLERFEVLLRGNPSIHESGRDAYRVLFRAMTEADSDPEIHAALRRHITTLHRFLQSELAALRRVGVLRNDLAPDLISFLLIDIAIGFGMLSTLRIPRHSSAAGRETLHELIADLLVDG